MHICFLSSMHEANDKRVFDKEALSLVKVGHIVTHLCPGDNKDSIIYSDVRTIKYPRSRGLIGRIRQLVRLYRQATDIDADAYHCNEVDSWIIGVLIHVLRKKICVFDVHEHYPSSFADSRFPSSVKPIVSMAVLFVFRLLTPFTDRIVMAKESVAPDFHTREDKKVIIKNYTSIEAIQFTDTYDDERETKAGVLVHLGLFSKTRGWPQVLEAMALMRHKNTFLKVIGKINDGSQPEFEKRVKEYGLEKRVAVYDWMPFKEAFAHLQTAHVGLITFQPGILNHVYAMPHKMFDYMAAGMAVVCPAFAVEVAPIIEESSAGVLIDPASPVDIARKLDSLLDDRRELREMGKRGQSAVREKYNWEAESQKLIQMYAELELKKH